MSGSDTAAFVFWGLMSEGDENITEKKKKPWILTASKKLLLLFCSVVCFLNSSFLSTQEISYLYMKRVSIQTQTGGNTPNLGHIQSLDPLRGPAGRSPSRD